MIVCYCGHKKEYHKSETRHKVCMHSTCECIDFKKADVALFVKMGDTALRLEDRSWEGAGLVYYRDAGGWYVQFKIENDKLIAQVHNKNSKLRHSHGLELVTCSKEEYKEDNGRYACV